MRAPSVRIRSADRCSRDRSARRQKVAGRRSAAGEMRKKMCQLRLKTTIDILYSYCVYAYKRYYLGVPAPIAGIRHIAKHRFMACRTPADTPIRPRQRQPRHTLEVNKTTSSKYTPHGATAHQQSVVGGRTHHAVGPSGACRRSTPACSRATRSYVHESTQQPGQSGYVLFVVGPHSNSIPV